ncbi:hypothetical protein N9L43_00220 [bacterium]|nr:hypothetical protein [bacterium]
MPVSLAGVNEHDRAVIRSHTKEYESTSDRLKKAELVLELADSLQGYSIKRRLIQVNIRSLRGMTSGMSQSRLEKRNLLLAKSYYANAQVLFTSGTGDLGRESLFNTKQIADKHPDQSLRLNVNSAISNLYHQ